MRGWMRNARRRCSCAVFDRSSAFVFAVFRWSVVQELFVYFEMELERDAGIFILFVTVRLAYGTVYSTWS